MGNHYANTIRHILASEGYLGTDPRHVEAWMRVETPTLDHLSASDFTAAVIDGAACVRQASTTDSESLAASFGL